MIARTLPEHGDDGRVRLKRRARAAFGGRDLARHEPAIRQALEQELVVHLYNTTGQFKHGLQQDAVALKAVELLESDGYLNVLAGPDSK